MDGAKKKLADKSPVWRISLPPPHIFF
jgi:hypothetical protein